MAVSGFTIRTASSKRVEQPGHGAQDPAIESPETRAFDAATSDDELLARAPDSRRPELREAPRKREGVRAETGRRTRGYVPRAPAWHGHAYDARPKRQVEFSSGNRLRHACGRSICAPQGTAGSTGASGGGGGLSSCSQGAPCSLGLSCIALCFANGVSGSRAASASGRPRPIPAAGPVCRSNTTLEHPASTPGRSAGLRSARTSVNDVPGHL